LKAIRDMLGECAGCPPGDSEDSFEQYRREMLVVIKNMFRIAQARPSSQAPGSIVCHAAFTWGGVLMRGRGITPFASWTREK
jgi:hypothetical protein